MAPVGTYKQIDGHVNNANIVNNSDLVNTYYSIMISIIAYIMDKVYPHVKTRIKIGT